MQVTIKMLLSFTFFSLRVRKGKARTRDSFVGLGKLYQVMIGKAVMRSISSACKVTMEENCHRLLGLLALITSSETETLDFSGISIHPKEGILSLVIPWAQ